MSLAYLMRRRWPNTNWLEPYSIEIRLLLVYKAAGTGAGIGKNILVQVGGGWVDG